MEKPKIAPWVKTFMRNYHFRTLLLSQPGGTYIHIRGTVRIWGWARSPFNPSHPSNPWSATLAVIFKTHSVYFIIHVGHWSGLKSESVEMVWHWAIYWGIQRWLCVIYRAIWMSRYHILSHFGSSVYGSVEILDEFWKFRVWDWRKYLWKYFPPGCLR